MEQGRDPGRAPGNPRPVDISTAQQRGVVACGYWLRKRATAASLTAASITHISRPLTRGFAPNGVRETLPGAGAERKYQASSSRHFPPG